MEPVHIAFAEVSEAKRKRHRRGKKKYGRRACPCVAFGEIHKGNAESQVEHCSDERHTKTKVKKRNRRLPQLRPTVSPKAPQNYTQFLMDDQETYKCTTIECESDYSGSSDVNDFVLEETLESSDFLRKNFDMDFDSARADELAKKSKTELINDICQLEQVVHRLQQNVNVCEKACALRGVDADDATRLLKELESLRQQHGALLAEYSHLHSTALIIPV